MTIYFPVKVWQAPVENSRVHRKQKNVALKKLVSLGAFILISLVSPQLGPASLFSALVVQ